MRPADQKRQGFCPRPSRPCFQPFRRQYKVVSENECSAGGWYEEDHPFHVYGTKLYEASMA